MKTKLNLWFRGISRSMANLYWLKHSVLNVVIKIVQTQLFSFLWKNKKDKIKRAVIYQPLVEGGLNFINFATMVKSLCLAWKLFTRRYQ